MNTSFSYTRLAAGLLTCAASLAAQQSPVQGLAQAPVATTMANSGPERALWNDGAVVRGGGQAYSVVFDRGGMSFTPALGRKASRNYPLRFELESIRRDGGVPLPATSGTAAPVIVGDAVHYAHGMVTERYDVRHDGVEQSFVFASRPGGSGDLVVRGRLVTELQPEPRAASDALAGLRFTAEGVGGVHYGGVTGVGASGRTTAGSLRLDGQVIELVLPSAFVDSASYPMVLDPLIGVSLNAGSPTFDDADSDVAYEATTNVYLFVWVRTFSNTSTEIRAQRVDATSGAKIGGFLAITSTPAARFNTAPSVAAVATTDRFLIAWQTAPSGFGPWDVSCRAVNAGTAVLSAITPIAATAANETAPDVGGERNADDEAIVVWDDDDMGILAAQVTLNSAGDDPNVFGQTMIRAGTGTQVGNPAISKSGGNVGRFLIVHDLDVVTPAIVGQVVTRNLALIGSSLSIAVDTLIAEDSADVDGNGSSFAVVWGETESGLAGSRDVYCHSVAATATTSMIVGAKVALAVNTNTDERNPAIGFCGPKFVTTWTSDTLSFLGSEIRVNARDPRNCANCGARFGLPVVNDVDRSSSVGTRWAGGSTSDDAMITHTSYRLAGFFGDVIGTGFSALGQGGPITTVRPSCGGGGTCSVSAPFAFGNTVRIRLTGGDAGAGLAAVHIGSQVSPIAPCGTCSILNPFAVVAAPINGGNASIPLSIGCPLSLLGASLRFQYVIANTLATPCLGLPVGLSNIVDAQLDF